MTTINEADVEQAALDWLAGVGWDTAHGPDIAPETPHSERDDYGQVVLERRLRNALAELNLGLDDWYVHESARTCRRISHPRCYTLIKVGEDSQVRPCLLTRSVDRLNVARPL